MSDNSSSPTSSPVGYRRDIDGLRAIAVVAVIIYHAKLDIFGYALLPGGFFGVDIFFVISGYLISKILLLEVQDTGRISLLRFYERRARRILPALIAVSIFTLGVGWFFLLPGDYADLGASVIAAFLFVSNFFFFYETTEYGADDALLEPFLHTWSLSVEEQFYLVFPLLLLILFRWARSAIVPSFVIISMASFAFAIAYANVDADLNFFLPISRVWELLTGALVACYEIWFAKKTTKTVDQIAKVIPALGVVLILAPLFLVASTDQHPGLVTVLPVLGTALVLAFGPHDSILGRLLASRVSVAIGLLSYSLYLWHFPIFAFGRMSGGIPTLGDKLVWVLITLILATLSYFYVERPLRKQSIVPRKVFAIGLGSGLGGVFLASGLVIGFDGIATRVPQELTTLTKAPGYRTLATNGSLCHNHPDGYCEFSLIQDAPVSVIITGDSHADSLSNDLFSKLQTRNISSFLQMTAGGCPIVYGFSIEGRKSCTPEMVQRRLEIIEDRSVQQKPVVVYFTRTPAFLSGKRYDGGPGRVEGGPDFKHVVEGDRVTNLSNTLERLSQIADLIIVYPMPELGIHAQRYFLNRIRPVLPGKLERVMQDAPLGVSEEAYNLRAASSFAVLDDIVIPDAQRIYPHELLCGIDRQEWCSAHLDGQLLYTDSNHPNWILADNINNMIVDAIDGIIAETQAGK